MPKTRTPTLQENFCRSQSKLFRTKSVQSRVSSMLSCRPLPNNRDSRLKRTTSATVHGFIGKAKELFVIGIPNISRHVSRKLSHLHVASDKEKMGRGAFAERSPKPDPNEKWFADKVMCRDVEMNKCTSQCKSTYRKSASLSIEAWKKIGINGSEKSLHDEPHVNKNSVKLRDKKMEPTAQNRNVNSASDQQAPLKGPLFQKRISQYVSDLDISRLTQETPKNTPKIECKKAGVLNDLVTNKKQNLAARSKSYDTGLDFSLVNHEKAALDLDFVDKSTSPYKSHIDTCNKEQSEILAESAQKTFLEFEQKRSRTLRLQQQKNNPIKTLSFHEADLAIPEDFVLQHGMRLSVHSFKSCEPPSESKDNLHVTDAARPSSATFTDLMNQEDALNLTTCKDSLDLNTICASYDSTASLPSDSDANSEDLGNESELELELDYELANHGNITDYEQVSETFHIQNLPLPPIPQPPLIFVQKFEQNIGDFDHKIGDLLGQFSFSTDTHLHTGSEVSHMTHAGYGKSNRKSPSPFLLDRNIRTTSYQSTVPDMIRQPSAVETTRTSLTYVSNFRGYCRMPFGGKDGSAQSYDF